MQHLLCLSFKNTRMCYSKTFFGLHRSFLHYQMPSVLRLFSFRKYFFLSKKFHCVFFLSGDSLLRIRTWCSSSLCSLDWLCLWSLVPLRALLRTETVGDPTPHITRDMGVTSEMIVTRACLSLFVFQLRIRPPAPSLWSTSQPPCRWLRLTWLNAWRRSPKEKQLRVR